jgi:DNA-binding NtrC family response regulator
MPKRIKRRALVVDDDRSMVRTLADVLMLKGWDVSTAFDGEAALAAVTKEAFDVVLMDVKMPGMDGVAAFKAMKEANPDVRVVLMTAYAAHELMMEAECAGVLRIVPKPINVPELLELLAGNLEHRLPVLIIDNDAAFLKTLSEVLCLRGFEILEAKSLREALRLMTERPPAAVLLHMHLESATPREAVMAVQQASPDVALVLYSGRPGAEEEARRTLPPDSVHTYLQKPFAIGEVTGVLDAISSG